MIVLLIVIQRYPIRSRKFQAINIYLCRWMCAESQLSLHRIQIEESIGLLWKGLFVQLIREIGMQKMVSGIVTYFKIRPMVSSEYSNRDTEHRSAPPFYMDECKKLKLK